MYYTICVYVCVVDFSAYVRMYVRTTECVCVCVCVYSPVADLSFADVGIIGKRNGQRVLLIRIGNRRWDIKRHRV